MAGVIPVIFAAAVMAFLAHARTVRPVDADFVNQYFQATSLAFLLAEGVLIVVFTYFYTAVEFNPIDQADNCARTRGTSPASDRAGPLRSTSTGC